MKEIIVSLKNTRKQKRITLKSLSQKTGISIKQLSKIENFKAIPRLSTLQKIADALEVEISITNSSFYSAIQEKKRKK